MKIHRVLLFYMYVTQVKVELCIIYMYIERKWQMNRQVVKGQEGKVRQHYLNLSIWACTGGYPPFNWVEKHIIWWHHTEKEATRSSPLILLHLSICPSTRMSLSSSLHPSPPPPTGSLHFSVFTCICWCTWSRRRSVSNTPPPPMVCQIDSQGSLSCL